MLYVHYLFVSVLFVLGMTLNCIWQWRAWTGLEDRMRLPQMTVTFRQPLAKAQNPLSPHLGMVKSVAARWWMWEQASTNRPVVWLKSCIAWQKLSATEQTAGENNPHKWGTVTVGEEMGTAYSINQWNPLCYDEIQQ